MSDPGSDEETDAMPVDRAGGPTGGSDPDAATRRCRASSMARRETQVGDGAVTLAPLDESTLTSRFKGVDDTGTGPDMSVGQQAITHPDPVPRFVVEQPLGRGGQGIVYAVRDHDTGRVIAVKTLRGREHDAGQIARFVHEAQVTAQLEHPGVVPVHDLHQLADGTLYYSMKRIQGETLDRIIQRGGQGQTYDLLQIFLRVCETVEFAHAKGVLHRDLKPANIMVGAYGEVLVLDWGLSKVLGEAAVTSLRALEETAAVEGASAWRTLDGLAVGTPAFMSPEQAGGESQGLRPCSDVYSLGVILYELLRACSPYPSTSAREVMQLVVDGEWEPLSERRDRLAPSLIAIVHKAMAYEPSDRYQSAAELSADINAYLAGKPVSVYAETLVERLLRNATRHRAAVRSGLWVGLSAASLVFCGLLGWHLHERLELAAMHEQAARLQLEGDYDRARDLYVGIVGRDPADRIAQEALAQDRVRRDQQAQRRLEDELVAEARAMLAQVQAVDASASVAALDRALRSLDTAIGKLPSGREDALRAELLSTRDRIIALQGQQAAQRAEAAALAQLPRVAEAAEQKRWRDADVLLSRAAEVLGDQHERVSALRRRIEAGQEERLLQLRLQQTDELLSLARSAHAEGRFGDAKAYLKSAVEVTPVDRAPERLAELLAVRDTVVADENAALAAEAEQALRARIDGLREQILASLQTGATLQGRALLERLREIPEAVGLVPGLERRLAAEERRQQEARADELLRAARTDMDAMVEEQDRIDALRREWRRLRNRLAELDEEQRQREFVLEDSISDGEEQIVQLAGRVIAALQQARGLAADYPPVRAALADYYAWRVRSSERNGDDAAAAADAADGRLYDDADRYRLLFAGEGLLHNHGDATLQVSAFVEQPDRVLVPAGPSWRLQPGAELTLPIGRYQLTFPGCPPMATRLDRGNRLQVRAPPATRAPEGTVLVPAGTVWDSDGQASAVEAFCMMRYELRNADYLTFLNSVGSHTQALLYPRAPDEPEQALWAQRSSGRYELRLRSGQDLDPDAPVTGISIDDARVYAAWLRERTGVDWRLPRLAEWRLAAQGGDGRSYPWGDDPALGNCYSAYNHDTGRAQVARTVGSFPADCSVQGVYDLAGSVAEFVDGSWIDHPTFALYCGGSYGDRDPQRFTTTAEGVVDVRQVHPRIGIRLICAVPEP